MRFNRSLFTTAALAVVVSVSGLLLLTAGASTPNAPSPQAWHRDVSFLPVPGKGCYHTVYPQEGWQTTPCAAAPTIPNVPAVPAHRPTTPAPASVGNGSDYVAQVTGLIASATGSFADVTPGITEKGQYGGTGSQLPNMFSLQLNANFFTSPACAGISSCLGWQQFIYDSGNSAIYMQYC